MKYFRVKCLFRQHPGPHPKSFFPLIHFNLAQYFFHRRVWRLSFLGSVAFLLLLKLSFTVIVFNVSWVKGGEGGKRREDGKFVGKDQSLNENKWEEIWAPKKKEKKKDNINLQAEIIELKWNSR